MAIDSRVRTGALVGVVVGVLLGLAVGLMLDGAPEEPGDERRPPITAEAGPTGVVNGIPSGFARTEDGAIAAATNFNLLSARDELLSEESLVRAMTTLAAPAWAEEAARQGENGYEYVSTTYGDDADVTAAVMRHELVHYSPDEATVRLWVITAISGSSRPSVEAAWGIVTTQLEWIDDDWRVADITSSPGPAPVELPSGQPELTALEVMEAFDEFNGAPAP